jgi:hypothetical protein
MPEATWPGAWAEADRMAFHVGRVCPRGPAGAGAWSAAGIVLALTVKPVIAAGLPTDHQRPAVCALGWMLSCWMSTCVPKDGLAWLLRDLPTLRPVRQSFPGSFDGRTRVNRQRHAGDVARLVLPDRAEGGSREPRHCLLLIVGLGSVGAFTQRNGRAYVRSGCPHVMVRFRARPVAGRGPAGRTVRRGRGWAAAAWPGRVRRRSQRSRRARRTPLRRAGRH